MNAVPHDDDWLLDEGPPPVRNPFESLPWKLLVVDDEPDVHAVTRLALKNVEFKGRPLQIFSAYSASEGYEVLSQHPDMAIMLLDVVMETDDAGLRLVRRVREELGNYQVRIVLRTGQPGQAPEQKVIVEYDINDYKAKTDLTTQKLFTTVVASLRSFESLVAVDRSRQGLAKILEGATNLYQLRSLQEFSSGILKQISAILNVGADGVVCVKHNPSDPDELLQVIAATGTYEGLVNRPTLDPTHALAPTMRKAINERRSQYEHPNDVLYIQTENRREFLITFTPPWPLGALERDLLEVFCNRICAAFDNLFLYDQLRRSQQATVWALASLAEYRDSDTGEHVLRVQSMTEAIVARLRLNARYAHELTAMFEEMVGLASILHDVGKVGTPDSILFKPGQHDPSERKIMEQHVANGVAVLSKAAAMVEGDSYLRLGIEIAAGHHEHWNGEGYPQGLKGEAIPLAGRIVAVADVYDALIHRRPYKEAWSIQDAVDYIKARSGTQFDPTVVDAFLQIISEQHPEIRI